MVFTLVLLLVLPRVKSDALHLTLVPLAHVYAAIRPRVSSEPVNHVALPVALVS